MRCCADWAAAGREGLRFELPWTPAFLHKHGGLVLSIGQFNQWVGSQLMATGLVQIWPGTPVSAPIFAGETGKERYSVKGIRLADQGVDRTGAPADGFMAGMDVRAPLTVVGDGPVGAVGQALDRRIGMPPGHAQSEWALGMKLVIELPEDSPLKPGTVWHTFGFPEPEIFGFLYVHPERLVSVGIFVPSWMGDPSRTAYRYLQHYIQHPALWRYLKDGTLRSWGAKSLAGVGQARRAVPDRRWIRAHRRRLRQHQHAHQLRRGRSVDHRRAARRGGAGAAARGASPSRRRTSTPPTLRAATRVGWSARREEAKNARNGFHGGLVRGLIGMALAGLTHGKLSLGGRIPSAQEQIRRF